MALRMKARLNGRADEAGGEGRQKDMRGTNRSAFSHIGV